MTNLAEAESNKASADSAPDVVSTKLTQLTEYIEGGESGIQGFDQHLLQMLGERVIAG